MPVSFSGGQRILFFTLLAAVTIAFLWIVRDYLMPVFWALIFALLLHPIYNWLHRKLKNGSLAATGAILFALMLIVLPASWLGTQVAQEAFDLYRIFAVNGSLTEFTFPPQLIELLETFGMNPEEVRADIAAWASMASAWLFSEAISFGSATFAIVIKTFLMLYLLFFFLRDGENLGRYIMQRLPLGDKKERALFNRFSSTTRAIVRGTILVAIVQGFIGGVLFWIAGIPNAILWGSVMALFSVIPAVGPFIVWLPAGIILFLSGDVVGAAIVLGGGVVIISTIDNVLRPILVGRETKMPDPLILVSIIGGLSVFGIAGLVIGPVIAALALATWDLFAEEYNKELSAQG